MSNKIKIGQYFVLMEKISLRMFSWNNGFKFICRLTFLNEFDIPILYLDLIETDIDAICRYIFDFIEFGSSETYIPLSYHDSNMNWYTFHIIKDTNDRHDSIVIKEFNSSEEILKDRIKIEFDNYSCFEDIFSFMETLYTIFLQDNKEYYYIGDYLYGSSGGK